MSGTYLETPLFVFYLIAKVSLLISVVVFFVGGLDDVLFDLYYLMRQTYRRLFIYRRHKRMDEKDLLKKDEQLIAIFIPAWREEDVIGRMLLNTIGTLDYKNYHLFVGTYPNDEGTGQEVEKVRRLYPNITRTLCSADGPTSKADNLNWVYQGMLAHEKAANVRFTGVVIHDCEDIIHPLELRLINYLLPRFSLVQIPVYPFESKVSGLTAGCYIDDFSENHTKDLLVRERLAGCIPTAGVGCAFSRKALDILADQHENLLFDPSSLTEDYEFGMKFRTVPGKNVFVRLPIQRVITRKNGKTRVKKEIIATREFFPGRFWDAVNQRARWTLGIAIQGWKNLGWKGPLATKLMLYRDRKVLVTSFIYMLGYIAFLYFILDVTTRLVLGYTLLPPLISERNWIYYLLWVVAVMMLERLFFRVFFVSTLFGPLHGVMSILRVPWGNLINFCATFRAMHQFFFSILTRKPITWLKTSHEFPDEENLRHYHRKLGDLLIEQRFIDVGQLSECLDIQKKTGGLLGEIMVRRGFIEEEDLMMTIGKQMHVSYEPLLPYETDLALLERIPKEYCEKNYCYPVRRNPEALVLATSELENFKRLDEIRFELKLSVPVQLVLSSRPDIDFAIRRGYGRGVSSVNARGEYIGSGLMKEGLIDSDVLEKALRIQKRDNRKLGDILVGMGAVSRQALETVMASGVPDDSLTNIRTGFSN